MKRFVFCTVIFGTVSVFFSLVAIGNAQQSYDGSRTVGGSSTMGVDVMPAADPPAYHGGAASPGAYPVGDSAAMEPYGVSMPSPVNRSPAAYSPSPSDEVPGRLDSDAGAMRMPVEPSPASIAPPSNYGASGAETAPAAPIGIGRPGPQLLEGAQVPQLVIQKLLPDEIQVGKPAIFKLLVRNVGKTAADEVRVVDLVPQGTRLVKTIPPAVSTGGGRLEWQVGRLGPSEESVVEMHLMPIQEGEIGSMATVSFTAAASARTICTKPQLVVRTTAPPRILIGEEVMLSIDVSNPGSGTATGIVLEERIPAGLRHPAGTALKYEVGDILPGQAKRLDLRLAATRPGEVTNVLLAKGDGGLEAEDQLDLTIVAPGLDLDLAGPQRRYLEREATYRLSVHNPGTASAEDVKLVAYLPSGLQFVRAGAAGTYNESDRAVYWHLEELPVGETGSVELVTMPTEPGKQQIRIHGTADRGVSIERAKPISIEGIAATMFEAVDVVDPIEIGGKTTYEIRVTNQGSKASKNIRLVVQLPPQLRALDAEGPTRHVISGDRVIFDGLDMLAPKADITYRVNVQGLEAGDLRTKVQLLTDDMTIPVTKEESTRVFSDR